MRKHLYKVIENYWGDIFIIKMGLRCDQFGLFPTKEKAQVKCDELNKELKK